MGALSRYFDRARLNRRLYHAREEVEDRLVAAGADIGEIQRLGDEWSLFFRDVDGTELEVCCKAA